MLVCLVLGDVRRPSGFSPSSIHPFIPPLQSQATLLAALAPPTPATTATAATAPATGGAGGKTSKAKGKGGGSKSKSESKSKAAVAAAAAAASTAASAAEGGVPAAESSSSLTTTGSAAAASVATATTAASAATGADAQPGSKRGRGRPKGTGKKAKEAAALAAAQAAAAAAGLPIPTSLPPTAEPSPKPKKPAQPKKKKGAAATAAAATVVATSAMAVGQEAGAGLGFETGAMGMMPVLAHSFDNAAFQSLFASSSQHSLAVGGMDDAAMGMGGVGMGGMVEAHEYGSVFASQGPPEWPQTPPSQPGKPAHTAVVSSSAASAAAATTAAVPAPPAVAAGVGGAQEPQPAEANPIFGFPTGGGSMLAEIEDFHFLHSGQFDPAGAQGGQQQPPQPLQLPPQQPPSSHPAQQGEEAVQQGCQQQQPAGGHLMFNFDLPSLSASHGPHGAEALLSEAGVSGNPRVAPNAGAKKDGAAVAGHKRERSAGNGGSFPLPPFGAAAGDDHHGLGASGGFGGFASSSSGSSLGVDPAAGAKVGPGGLPCSASFGSMSFLMESMTQERMEDAALGDLAYIPAEKAQQTQTRGAVAGAVGGAEATGPASKRQRVSLVE